MTNDTDDQLIARYTALCERGDQNAITAFLADLDAADAARRARLSTPGALTAAAVWYAANGIAVFPIRPRDKAPLIPNPHPKGSRERITCKGECGKDGHGLYDATTDLARVRAWWGKTSASNIGVRTGVTFDVIDIDGPPGFASLAELRESGTLPPLIGKVWTPGDPKKERTNAPGRHLYIRPTGDSNTAGVLPGVDYRGDGGYVLAPPSVGRNGKRYDWITPIDLTALKAAA